MRVGVLPYASGTIDGAFHYEIVFLNALSEIAPRFPEEFVCLTSPENNLSSLARTGDLKYRGVPVCPLHQTVIQQGPPEAYPMPPPLQAQQQIYPNALYCERENALALRRAGVDLVLQLSQQGLQGHAFASLLPFVTPIYDLNHRLQPEFPEVSAYGEYNAREYIFGNICRFATLVLVDSEVGKEDVLRFYGNLIDEDRIRVLPYYPPVSQKPMPGPDECARVAAKYRLPQRYFFYPAQFWRHKNHAAILHAVRIIADVAHEKVPVVFCGAYADHFRAANFIELRKLAGQLGVGGAVQYLGPVPDEDMAALYSLSIGLVMPTFFGPTNIPPLEAWHFARPVITSDIRGLREQNGDASLLVDPRSPDDLARAMLRLWGDPALCAELAERGRKRLAAYSWNSFVNGVSDIVSEGCERVRSGRSPQYPEGALNRLMAPQS